MMQEDSNGESTFEFVEGVDRGVVQGSPQHNVLPQHNQHGQSQTTGMIEQTPSSFMQKTPGIPRTIPSPINTQQPSVTIATQQNTPPPLSRNLYTPPMTQPTLYTPPATQPNLYQPPVTQPNLYTPPMTQPNLYKQSVSQPNLYTPSVTQPNLYTPRMTQPNLYTPPVTQPSLYTPPLTQPSLYTPPVIQPNLYTPPMTQPNLYKPPVTQPNLYTPPMAQPNLYAPPMTQPTLYTPPVTQPNLNAPPVTQHNLYMPPVTQPTLGTPPVTQPNLYTPPVTQPNLYMQPVAQPNQYPPDVSQSNMFPRPPDMYPQYQQSQVSSFGVNKSLFVWMKDAMSTGGGLISKVAERAQSSVTSMITTLDPQMRDFIYSGGDIDIIIASDKEAKISPLRDAFQTVFGKATVKGLRTQATTIAAQPVSFVAGIKAAEERINNLRSHGLVHQHQPIVAVENFLLEVMQDKWCDVGVLVLSDLGKGINLHTFTQLTPIPVEWVTEAQERTHADYPLSWSGLELPIGDVAGRHLKVPNSEWHAALTGVSRGEMIVLAGRALAGLYKSALNGMSSS